MADARRAKRAASNCTPSMFSSGSSHESTTRARDDLPLRERIANDQHQRSAHHCSRERAQISIAARRRERRRAASPQRDIAPGRRVSHAHERLKNPAAHDQGSDLESFEHGICALEAARGHLRPALKSPIGPIGTSIPAAYGVCEHRDNGSEPIASRQHAPCYRLPPEASSTRHEGRGCEKVPVFDRVRRRTILPENGSPGERRAHHP
jgi:hypothetical protein